MYATAGDADIAHTNYELRTSTMTPAIRVENLGKCYRVNHESRRKGYQTVRESVANFATKGG